MVDGNKIGLVVEGGGHRGVISAAMLCALYDRGFSHAFDAVYGCSSGAVNAAYFVAGQPRAVYSFYRELGAPKPLKVVFAIGSCMWRFRKYAESLIRKMPPIDYESLTASPVDLF